MPHISENLFLGKAAMVALALAGFLILTNVPRLSADDADCQRRVAHADHKLHEAIEHHGNASREAAHWRHELQEARERCWQENHKWWDEDAHRWHDDRDWDDHDHDPR